jgi:hypothetical protein
MRNGRTSSTHDRPELAMRDVVLRWHRNTLRPGQLKRGQRVVLLEIGGDCVQIAVDTWRDLLSLMVFVAPAVIAGLVKHKLITPPERGQDEHYDYCDDDLRPAPVRYAGATAHTPVSHMRRGVPTVADLSQVLWSGVSWSGL